MIASALSITDSETAAAAQYFATLKPHPWIRVVEITSVPRTRVAPAGMMCATQMALRNGSAIESSSCPKTSSGANCTIPARIAGRSPSYVFRQLYDMRQSVRAGVQSRIMAPVVAHRKKPAE